MTQWKIRPLVGVDPVSFGMTRRQISEVLGKDYPLEEEITQSDGVVREFRDISVPIFHFKNERLIHIDINSFTENVVLDDLNVFEEDTRKLMQNLMSANNGAFRVYNFILFEKICISTLSFFDPKSNTYYDPISNSQDNRVIGVFARENMQASQVGAEPIVLP